MVRKICVWALTCCAALALHPRGASSQEVTAPVRGRSVIEFTYGWDGGFSRGADGNVRMRDYPSVKAVVAGSPAARAGLRVGDLIVSSNGRDGRTPPLFEGIRPGTQVVLRIRRGDDEREITFVAREPGTGRRASP
jgi:C-terminal processing protease CtpA/Prc